MNTSQSDAASLSPDFKKSLKFFASSRGHVLDIPCGYGRHTSALLALGCRVTCIEYDENALLALKRKTHSIQALGPQRPHVMLRDIIRDLWPFPPKYFDGAINVHFLDDFLLLKLTYSLRKGALLYVETVRNLKGNSVELLPSGSLEKLLTPYYEILHLRELHERSAGNTNVAVRFLGRRRPHQPRASPLPRCAP